MIELQEAKDYLRVDGTENDEIIESILTAIPPYIELATGLRESEQDAEPMCAQASKCLLALWYNVEQAEADKLERVIESLLKSISLKHNR